jgi:hypothetical protein
MFYVAYSFNQDISGWDVINASNMKNMFDGVKLSTAFYNSILTSWASKTLKSGVYFHGGNSMYSPGDGITSRLAIIANYGWNITDGGLSNLPAISTQALSNINMTSATSGGNITEDAGSAVTARGGVWNTSPNPTISSYLGITSNGSGVGAYTSSIAGLNAGETYYVRAYATNGNGTEYGNSIKFIAQQELTLSGNFTANNKEYDRRKSATLVNNSLTLSGIIGSDDVTLTDLVLTFDNSNAGNNKTVSILSAQLAGTDANMYRISVVGSPTTRKWTVSSWRFLTSLGRRPMQRISRLCSKPARWHGSICSRRHSENFELAMPSR